LDPKVLKSWVRKFRRAWPAMVAEEKLALWDDYEPEPETTGLRQF
jgi:hypothetical protein